MVSENIDNSVSNSEKEGLPPFPAVEKYFYIISAAGVFICWISALFFYINSGIEYGILYGLNTLRSNPFFAAFWYYYTKWFIYVFGVTLFIIYFISFRNEKLRKLRLPMFIALVGFGTGNILVDYILKPLVGRPRPFVAYPEIIPLYRAGGYSFPSGHSFAAFIMTLPLITALLLNSEIFKRKGYAVLMSALLLTYAVTMALSRVLVGVHYPSDILFSAGLAFLLNALLYYIFGKIINVGKMNAENEKYYAALFSGFAIVYVVIGLIF